MKGSINTVVSSTSTSGSFCVSHLLGCSDKKDSEATAARLKGNRLYKAKRWEKALELYMNSLKARPYAVNTLANVAQVRHMLSFPRDQVLRQENVTTFTYEL